MDQWSSSRRAAKGKASLWLSLWSSPWFNEDERMPPLAVFASLRLWWVYPTYRKQWIHRAAKGEWVSDRVLVSLSSSLRNDDLWVVKLLFFAFFHHFLQFLLSGFPGVAQRLDLEAYIGNTGCTLVEQLANFLFTVALIQGISERWW